MRRQVEEERVIFDPVEVLLGLSPSLVEDLATFVGSTEEDLLISFQIMPWGDRAALAAFGIVELSETPGERGRVISVAPAAVDLVNAAFEALQTTGEHATHAEESSVLAGAAVPLVQIVSDSGQEAWAVDEEALTVPAVIESVDRHAAYLRLRMKVPVSGDPLGRRDVAVEVASLTEDDFTVGSTVRLLYPKDTTSLGHPSRLKVEDALHPHQTTSR